MATFHIHHLPLELFENIVHFAIRARSFNRALRLRLVNRQFRVMVEDNMFRTRLLDKYVHALTVELRSEGNLLLHRPGGQDTPWLAFLKRYLAHRIVTQPNLDPQCPESLFHRAAARLGQLLGGNANEDDIRGHIATLCQVGFWEHFCCYRYPGAVFDPCSFVYPTPNVHACYDGGGPLKRILLDAAVYLGNVDLAKKIYAMEPKVLGSRTEEEEDILEDRIMIAAVHGGVDMFRLVNSMELGLETRAQYQREYSDDSLMDYIFEASSRRGNNSLIHFLLDLGDPWDGTKPSAWTHHILRSALLHAQTPDIFERLASLAGPGFTPQSSHHKNGDVICRATPMAYRLAHYAAADNPVMIRYLLDHGGAPFLDNPDPAALPTPATTSEELERLSWLKRNSRTRKLSQQRPLIRAIEAGNVDTVVLMLERGADPNRHAVGLTPLAAAVRRCDLRIARLLIEYGGADPNLGTPPPIALAVEAENPAMVDLLLGNGAVVDTPETGGWAMALAEEQGLESMRDLLAGLGVEPGAAWHHVHSLQESILGGKYFDVGVASD